MPSNRKLLDSEKLRNEDMLEFIQLYVGQPFVVDPAKMNDLFVGNVQGAKHYGVFVDVSVSKKNQWNILQYLYGEITDKELSAHLAESRERNDEENQKLISKDIDRNDAKPKRSLAVNEANNNMATLVEGSYSNNKKLLKKAAKYKWLQGEDIIIATKPLMQIPGIHVFEPRRSLSDMDSININELLIDNEIVFVPMNPLDGHWTLKIFRKASKNVEFVDPGKDGYCGDSIIQAMYSATYKYAKENKLNLNQESVNVVKKIVENFQDKKGQALRAVTVEATKQGIKIENQKQIDRPEKADTNIRHKTAWADQILKFKQYREDQELCENINRLFSQRDYYKKSDIIKAQDEQAVDNFAIQPTKTTANLSSNNEFSIISKSDLDAIKEQAAMLKPYEDDCLSGDDLNLKDAIDNQLKLEEERINNHQTPDAERKQMVQSYQTALKVAKGLDEDDDYEENDTSKYSC